MVGVVGEGALLQDVARLEEHLLEVKEELEQLLGCPSHEITETRYCTEFSTKAQGWVQ